MELLLALPDKRTIGWRLRIEGQPATVLQPSEPHHYEIVAG